MAKQLRASDVGEPAGGGESRRESMATPDDTIRGRAYEIFEARGGASGHDLDDWLQAEGELRANDNRER